MVKEKKETLIWTSFIGKHEFYQNKTLEGHAEATQFLQCMVSFDACTENAWWEV